ncbi:MAG TPA: FAD-dependent oxidoreductase [Thermoanaerobaculia bacterium]|nr:FAD-dependent oxidoreductase [Thermoanaerobaculia bacterium]
MSQTPFESRPREVDPVNAAAVSFIEEGSAFLQLREENSPAVSRETERLDVVVIGGGQAGLSVGYYLARSGSRFVILDANERVGDSWRRRWDSLRLFTAARYDGLVGMPFPAPPDTFPTKDEMADYLEAYAKRFALPVRNGVRVERLSRDGDRYVVEAGGRRFEAPQVVVAMANYQRGRVPPFAADLDPGIVQLHSSEYRNPSQFREGGVLVVGAGNSGAEIALEAARRFPGSPVWLAGRDPGHVPVRIDSRATQRFLAPLLFRGVFHRVLTLDTPLGRKARPAVISKGALLIRLKPEDLAAAGIQRVPRVAGVRDGKPLLADGRVLDVANVIWATGFDPGFSWIDLPVLDRDSEPKQVRGIVKSQPGLYFVGVHFLYAMSSSMIHGVARDAKYVADAIARRLREISARTANRPGPAQRSLSEHANPETARL